MDLSNYKICENAFAKRKSNATARMIFSKDMIRFNATTTRVLAEMGCERADIYVDVENKKIALVGNETGGVKLQETGVRLLRDMAKALNGLYSFIKPDKERVTWGRNYGYSQQEYECTTIAEIDKKNKAIVFDISDCQKME